MSDDKRSRIAAAIDRISAALDHIEEEPAAVTDTDFKQLNDELARLKVLCGLLSFRFSLDFGHADIDRIIGARFLRNASAPSVE